MTLCKFMVLDFKGQLQGIPSIEAYDEYDLRKGVEYCKGWLALGETHDLIDHFDLKEFMKWCKGKLKERPVQKK